MKLRTAGAAVASLIWLAQGQAAAWDPFVVENDHVAAGNERMGERDAQGALTHYDRAARELPGRAEVHLNRGLALLEAGEMDRAREAFLLATEPPAEAGVRADAYYDLGLAFYRQADAAASAEEPNHQEAQRLFREAADSFRQSLRIRPGNADAGWNLELALRRIREQEQQQQEQEQEQQQDQQQQDQQQQDQQQQDQQQQDQQQQDQQQQDQQQQDPQQQDPQQQDPQQQDPQQSGDPSSDSEDPSADEGPREGGEDSGSEGQTREQPPTGEGTMEGLPPEHQRVLDALEQGEDNLERHRARVRAQQERRRVEQDW
jgi:Ca-activated chloride channel family protein